MLLYYITDRSQFPGDETSRRKLLLRKIAEAAHGGIDFIQLRERNLSIRELESLAREALRAIRENSAKQRSHTRLLINSRTDVAIAGSAHGVHLRSDDISPDTVRQIWRNSPVADTKPMISVACHTVEEVSRLADTSADFALFAPVFEKPNAASQSPTGLESLRQACRAKIPVIALGGISLENARSCFEAGAAGVAGIRLFQKNDLTEAVLCLRNHSNASPASGENISDF